MIESEIRYVSDVEVTRTGEFWIIKGRVKIKGLPLFVPAKARRFIQLDGTIRLIERFRETETENTPQRISYSFTE